MWINCLSNKAAYDDLAVGDRVYWCGRFGFNRDLDFSIKGNFGTVKIKMDGKVDVYWDDQFDGCYHFIPGTDVGFIKFIPYVDEWADELRIEI